MSNTLYFLRHGETVRNKDIPSIDWSISDEAKTDLAKLARLEQYKNITHIYTSHEKKAKESALPFSKATGIEPVTIDGLEEVHRGTAYVSDKVFKELKQTKLENRDSNPDNGETSNEALLRFKNTIDEINTKHEDTEILIVSHGTILALYFSYLKNDFQNIFTYWKNIPFSAIGVVKDSKVIQDFSH